MLFRDFFPRLCDRAWERYGVRLTKRQFTNWREQGLLPGPAPPIGRGRGRCPDRHWPATSYRRALRICRYQSGNARRTSEWWLGFWLSGDPIDPTIIRASLKREISIDRRRNRAFSESNRWRNSKFRSFADADRGGLVGNGDARRSLPMIGLTPDQFRRLSILNLVESDNDEDIDIIQEMSIELFPFDQVILNEIRADIDHSEYKRLYRPGRLAEVNASYGNQLDKLSDNQINDIPEIWRLRKKGEVLVFHIMRLMGDMPPDRIGLFLIPMLSRQPFAIKHRISELLRISFEVYVDIEQDVSSDWRLTGAQASNEEMLFTIELLIQQKRKALQ